MKIQDKITLPLDYSAEVREAINSRTPVLGLETTILSHGMPYPDNIAFAEKAAAIVRKAGAVPATIALSNGRVKVGLSDDLLEQITGSGKAVKVGVRDLGSALVKKQLGATTVSSTIRLARLAGINVCSTGGIGGVHRGFSETMDVSQDIHELSRTGVILISSGAKAILDIPKTLELLETYAIPVLGYKTDTFPVFYTRNSDHGLTARVESPEEIVRCYQSHLSLGLSSAVLVANPVPEEHEISSDEVSQYILKALDECVQKKISGKEVTPFLLNKLFQLSDGKTQITNQALAFNNYLLGAETAVALSILNQKE